MNGRSIALVSGAKGSLGRYVSQSLVSKGLKVVGIGHGNSDNTLHNNDGNFVWYEKKITLENLLSLNIKPELVIHCAGSGSVGLSITNPYQDFVNNVQTTASLLEYVRAICPDAPLVIPSSAAVYGNVKKLPISESDDLSPSSPYGVHKKMAEDLVLEYSKHFGIRSSIVRLFSIYGEGFRKQLLWDSCKKIHANQTVFFGTGEETRDWLHVSDAADLLIEASKHASTICPIVNGGYGQQVSVKEIVSELFKLMGRKDTPQFCGTERVGDPKYFHADMQLISSWSWSPKIDWKEGLKRYVEWFRKDQHI